MNDDKVKTITDCILKTVNPLKIILFGSYAYGKPNNDSDVDLAVVVNNDNQPFHDRIISLRRAIRTTTPLDLFVFTKDEMAQNKNNPVVSEILERGVTIYEQ